MAAQKVVPDIKGGCGFYLVDGKGDAAVHLSQISKAGLLKGGSDQQVLRRLRP